jgi:glycosyltransferase involved in cell wall biosynthesis
VTPPRISVVVCTHNRAAYLRKSLASLVDQTIDTAQFEIVLVDNASGDDTADVVREEFGHVPNLRHLHEPVLGISRARNKGWRAARGQIIACLDDDAVAEPDWLEAVGQFFDEGWERVGAVGGRIEPIWEAPRPAWLADDLTPSLTVLDWSDGVRPIRTDEWIVAANIAFPRSALEAAGGFRTDLGRRGTRLLSNEENLLRLEIEDLGLICYWDPRITVRHHVHATRLTRSWLRKRSWWQGVSDAVLGLHRRPASGVERVWRGLKAVGRATLSPRAVWSLATPTRDPERFHRSCLTWYRLGYGTALLTARDPGVAASGTDRRADE